MADVKISELPVADALAGTELVAIVQGGVTSQTTVAALLRRAAGVDLLIAGGDSAGGDGAYMYLRAGGATNGGNVEINGGDTESTDGAGGSVELTAGDGDGSGLPGAVFAGSDRYFEFDTSYTRTDVITVAQLPAAGTAGRGARSFVTDALTTLALGIGTVVANGGANKVPVYCDGTNWLYG